MTAVTVPILGAVIPSIEGLIAFAAFTALGAAFASRTEISSRLAGRSASRARAIMTGFSMANAATVIAAAIIWNWDLLAIGIAGVISLIVYGILANYTTERIVPILVSGDARMPPPVPLDLATLNIHQLHTTEPSSGDVNTIHLGRDQRHRNVLNLPRGSVAASVLQHDGQTLAKIVAPVTDEQGHRVGCRVLILGLDTTRTPFLLELPPEYKDRSIEECERWLLQAGKDDEIIAT